MGLVRRVVPAVVRRTERSLGNRTRNTNMEDSIEIIEAYKDWKPPFNVKKLVERMLASVPSKYLGGLESIVLTNSAAFNHEEKRRQHSQSGQKYFAKDRLGAYYAAYKGSRAWIELVVDNMIANHKGYWLWLPITRDHVIGSTLFHELGHHIHKNFVREHEDKEETAETWRVKLEVDYARKQYIHKRILRLLAPLAEAVNKLAIRSEGYRRFQEREDGRLRKRSKR